MSRLDWVVALGALALFTAGCGGDESPAEEQRLDSKPSGEAEISAWLISAEWLEGIDLDTGESATRVIELDPDGVTHISNDYPIHPTERQVWVSRTDGSVIVVDAETLDTKTVQIANGRSGQEESNIAIGGGFAYVGTWETTSSNGVSIVKIDTQTLEETDRKEVLLPNRRFSRILFDQDRLWVLHDRGLREVEAATLAVRNDVTLAATGDGDMVAFEGSLWVVHKNSSVPLQKIDKTTQTVTSVRELSDEFAELDQDGIKLVANADSLFVSFSYDGVVAQLDGVTGATRAVHRIEGPAGWSFSSNTPLGVTNQTLYVGTRYEILAVDLATQAQRVAFTNNWEVRHFALAP